MIPGTTDASKEEMRQRINKIKEEITIHANELFDMIPPGMTIEVDLPVTYEIVVPNQQKERRILFITRPHLVWCLGSK